MMAYATTSSVGAPQWYCHKHRTNDRLEKDKRPLVPVEYTSPLLHELIGDCWRRDPNARSPFTETVGRLHRLRVIAGHTGDDVPVLSPSLSPLLPASISPSPRPICRFAFCFDFIILSDMFIIKALYSARPNLMGLWDTTDDYVAIPSALEVDALQMEDEKLSPDGITMPEPTHYLPNMRLQFPTVNLLYANPTVVRSDNDLSQSAVVGRHSPRPANHACADARNERRYRYLLEHEFNPSRRVLPVYAGNRSNLCFSDFGSLGTIDRATG